MLRFVDNWNLREPRKFGWDRFGMGIEDFTPGFSSKEATTILRAEHYTVAPDCYNEYTMREEKVWMRLVSRRKTPASVEVFMQEVRKPLIYGEGSNYSKTEQFLKMELLMILMPFVIGFFCAMIPWNFSTKHGIW